MVPGKVCKLSVRLLLGIQVAIGGFIRPGRCRLAAKSFALWWEHIVPLQGG